MKNTLSLLLTGIVLSACSTSTKTASTYKNVSNAALLGGAVAAGPSNTYQNDGTTTNMLPFNFQKTPHQVELNGVVLCENSGFINYKKLRVDVYEGEALASSLNVESDGKYFSTFKARAGKHSARLINRLDGKVLDSKDFSSSENEDRFTVNLTGCPK